MRPMARWGRGGWGSTRRALVRSIRSSERVTSNLRLPGSMQRDADRERAPLAGLALQVDVAAEELGQLADDRQAQAGPLVLAGQDVRRPGPGALAWRNFSKIVSRSSSAMPMPVSWTSMTTNRPSARAGG